jgi:hypothetical protein
MPAIHPSILLLFSFAVELSHGILKEKKHLVRGVEKVVEMFDFLRPTELSEGGPPRNDFEASRISP